MMKCLHLYTSGTGYFLMYLLCLMLIAVKGSKRDRQLFLPGAVVLLLTVYNPLFPVLIDRVFDISSEYYRFFWIAPVIILVPYTAVKTIYGIKSAAARVSAGLLVLIMFIAGGNFVYGNGFDMAQNEYKIPDELIEISSVIHEDSGTEYTKAFFEYEYNMEIRQYDPKMLLCIDREEYIYAMNYSYTAEMLSDEDHPTNRILALLVRNQEVDREDFTDALENTGTQYVVLTKGHPQAGFIKKAGLYEIGDTKTHVIYRYDLRQEHAYEPVDYSDAVHKFSWRRLK
ncbi:MAG: hypothetical protein K6E49_10480 [Lachnospiraceae bacterium]|nr:hypothetical protein [Lachnospiraceae bacterium]